MIKSEQELNELKKNLISRYGRCFVTGITNADILEASFIKPQHECNDDERIDIFNGLLLTPNYCKLFNEYLISFDLFGEILVSSLLSDDDLVKLGISKMDKILDGILTMSHAYYMEEHRIRLRVI